MPDVTVLMPVHDGARFLGEALDSVLTQTFADLEVVLVDDASTDDIAEVLQRYRDPRLRVFHRGSRGGTAAALNDGLLNARGRYVAQMHADDVSIVDRLERQVQYLDRNTRIGVVGANQQPVDADGVALGPATDLPTLPGHIHWMLHVHNCLNHPTVVARREVLRKVGGYRPETVPAEDYDLWVRAMAITRIANIPEIVLRYRIHSASASATRPEAMEASAVAAAEGALTRLLGAPPDPNALQVLRHPSRAQEAPIAHVRGAAELLWRFTDAVLEEHTLEPRERVAIRRSAVGWFSHLIRATGRDRPAAAIRVLVPGRGGPPAWALRETVAGAGRRFWGSDRSVRPR